MLRAVDEGFLRDRIGSPEDEHDPFPSLRYCSDSSIGEVFPSFSLMGCRFSLTDGENSIQEEDALLCPVGEISMSSFYTEIRIKFFEYISETWLHLASIWYGERESHSRSWRMVGILPEDHDFHSIEWSRVEGSEYIFPFWKTSLRSILPLHETRELVPVELLELGSEYSVPRWVDTDGHVANYSEKLLWRKEKILTNIYLFLK